MGIVHFARTSAFAGLFALGALAPFHVACVKKKQSTEVKEFAPLDDASKGKVRPDEPLPNFKVAGLEAAGVKYTVKRVGVRGDPATDPISKDPEMNFYTDVSIEGTLTSDQHAALTAHYGGKGIAYAGREAKTDWNLIDFLPPVVQAVDGTRFKTQEIPPPAPFPADYFSKLGMDANLDVSTNCHATAYEVARSLLAPAGEAPSFTQFFLGDVSSFNFFAGRTDPAADVASNEALAPVDAKAARDAGRKVGDVIQFWEPMLLHSAVWIDNDLYFEKTDTASEAPYRLVTYADMVAVPGLKTPLESGRMKVGFRRFVTGKMVSPAAFFGGNKAPPRAERDPAEPTKFTGKWTDPVPFSKEGLTGGAVANVYVGSFSGFGGKSISDPLFLREFPLEVDAASGRARLPAAAFEAKSFEPK